MIGFIGAAGLGLNAGSGGGASPTVQATNIVFTNIESSSLTISWTNGDGNARLVLIKAGSAVDGTPTNGVNYEGNPIFGEGNEIGTGNFVVYSGEDSTVDIIGLTVNTTYHVRVFEYNTGFTFFTSSATNNPSSQLTDLEPDVQASNIVFTDILTESFIITFDVGNGSERIVVLKAATAITGTPTDTTTYTANSTFGSGGTIATGEYVVYKGSGNSVTVTGLTLGVTYFARVFEFGGGEGSENYLTATALLNPNTQDTDYYGPNIIDEWFGNAGIVLRGSDNANTDKWYGYINNTELDRGTSSSWARPTNGIFNKSATTGIGIPNIRNRTFAINGSCSFLILLQKSAVSSTRVEIITATGDPVTFKADLQISNSNQNIGIEFNGTVYSTGQPFSYDEDFHALLFVIDSAGVFRFYMDGVKYGGDISIPSGGLNWTASDKTRSFFGAFFTGKYKKMRIWNEAVPDEVGTYLTDPANSFFNEVVVHRPARIFGFGGQSNMVGSNLLASDMPAYLRTEMPTAYIFINGNKTYNRVLAGTNPTNCGPLLRAMYDLMAKYPDEDLFCVQNASASKSLAEYFNSETGGPGYNALLANFNGLYAILDVEGRTIVGDPAFAWGQGEEDSGNLTFSKAYNHLFEQVNNDGGNIQLVFQGVDKTSDFPLATVVTINGAVYTNVSGAVLNASFSTDTLVTIDAAYISTDTGVTDRGNLRDFFDNAQANFGITKFIALRLPKVTAPITGGAACVYKQLIWDAYALFDTVEADFELIDTTDESAGNFEPAGLHFNAIGTIKCGEAIALLL
jgi:hypothetical protein